MTSNNRIHYPLTYPQQRIWYTELIHPESGLGNLSAKIVIKTKVFTDLLEEAIQGVIFSNDAMGIRFDTRETGEPYQYFTEDDGGIAIARHTFHKKEEAEEWIDSKKREKFEVLRSPLVYFAILDINQHETWVYFKMHHLISDGTSMVLVIDQILNNYESLLTEGDIYKKHPSYIQFIATEEQYLTSNRYEKDIQYWTNRFKDLPEPSGLKSYDLFAVSTRAKQKRFLIDPEWAEQIRHFCDTHQVSIFTLFMTALSIYLHKVTLSDDITIGTNMTNRTNMQEKTTVGMYTSTVPIRMSVNEELPFEKYLHQVAKEQMTVIRHQRYPYNLLIQRLRDQDSQLNRLFSISLLYQKVFIAKREKIDHESHYLFSEHEVDDFGIHIKEWAENDRITIDYEYRIDLFTEEEIETIHSHFQSLLMSCLSNPSQTVSSLQLATPDEQQELLLAFQGENCSIPEWTAVEAFERQVELTPNITAVIDGEKQWTYQQLNKKANQLAARLKRGGVAPETTVAIILDKSLEMIAAVLAVWKAGGAYVPIDPNYPDERIRYLLEDSRPMVTITDERLLQEFYSDLHGRANILVHDPLLHEESESNLPTTHTPSNLAYIIYTSGTTGKPKGVMIEHRSYMNVSRAWTKAYGLDAMNMGLLQMASFSFDVFAGDLSRTLLNGGTLLLCPNDMKLDPASLYHLLNNHQIHLFESTPALIMPLMNFIYEQRLPLPAMKLLILGSDSCSVSDFKLLLDRYGRQMRIINSYGVTEACIDSSYFEVDDSSEFIESGNVPIGKPLDNVSYYVLGQGDTLQPINVPGELCIGGAGVARGYFNRPELSASKFVPNPFRPGEYMYKTGDLVKWRPDGNMEYVGRMDFQVKIKGYRIELGEIESILMQHKSIKEAVVADRTNSSGAKELCAYVAVAEVIEEQELRAYLSSCLPGYMVPTYLLFMSKLPLTPNGKIDRKTLNEIPVTHKTEREPALPRNDVEDKLLTVWKDVLGYSQLGISDHFFECGGDSVKVMQVTSKLHRLGLQVNAKLIFQYPRIEQLSHYVVVAQDQSRSQQTEITGETLLAPIQRWFFEQHFTEENHWNQAVMLDCSERMDSERLERALQKLVVHHDALTNRFIRGEGGITQLGKAVESRNVQLQVWDLSGSENWIAEMERLNSAMQISFELNEGTMFAARLYRTPKGDKLGLAAHHLVVDGVSWRILLEDLSSLYQQPEQDGAGILPEKTDSYQKWTQALAAYAQSESLLQELDYWHSVERTASPELICDFEGEERLWKQCYKLRLPEQLTSKLLYDTHHAYHTQINDLLLAALGLALLEWKGIQSAVIHLEGHGRESCGEALVVHIDRTVGWFTSLFPFRVSAENADDLSYYLKTVKENIRKIPNSGIGYGLLKYMTPAHKRGEATFLSNPEICFNYLGQFDEQAGRQLFPISDLPTGLTIGEKNVQSYLLEINAMVRGGRFELEINYNSQNFMGSTIEHLGRCYESALRRIVEHCSSRQTGEKTPSDLGYSKMSIEQLDALSQRLNLIIP